MDRNKILDVMEVKAEELFTGNVKSGGEYAERGKRGAFTVQIRNMEIPGQWDISLRHFGASFWEGGRYGDLLTDSGCNFEAGMLGKAAYSRRTGKNSGVNCYETLGGETFWPGAVISGDGNCICAFGGLSAADDVLISQAGIGEYERQRG
jgi:hypothetical protein